MKMKKILLALVLALCTTGAAFAADVALTSIGQGPDAMMIKVIMRSLKITPDYEPLMKDVRLYFESIPDTVRDPDSLKTMLYDRRILRSILGGKPCA